MFQRRRLPKSAEIQTGSAVFAAALTVTTWTSAKTAEPQKKTLRETISKYGSRKKEKKRKKEEKKETHQKNTAKSAPKKKEKKKKSLMKRALLFLGIFAVIIFGMMSCLAPKVKNVTIDDFDWERTIDIEEIITHSESDWQLPDDARLQYTKNEIKSYEQVIDHYEKVTETKTRRVIDHYEDEVSHVDLGNGYFEEENQECSCIQRWNLYRNTDKPVYRQEPVYATKYYYEIDRWTVVDTAKNSGRDQNPAWPEPKLKDNQRTGTKDEHYFVTATYEKKEGKTETERYEMDFSEWKKLKKGEKTDLKIDAAGFAEINKE